MIWQAKGKSVADPLAAGPESLEDYFKKGALFGQKAALNLWYVDTSCQIRKKLFPSI